MALTWDHDHISSDLTPHTARRIPGHENRWEVSWLPGWHLDRATALMTVVFAGTAGTMDICELHGNCDHRSGWAGLLGLTVPNTLARIAGPPYRAGQDNSALPADPEAAE